jgi:hypothetical protein
LKIIWKALVLFAMQNFRDGKQNFARSTARTLGRTTSIRIMLLSNSADEEEGSFSFNKREADVRLAAIQRIKQR